MQIFFTNVYILYYVIYRVKVVHVHVYIYIYIHIHVVDVGWFVLAVLLSSAWAWRTVILQVSGFSCRQHGYGKGLQETSTRV